MTYSNRLHHATTEISSELFLSKNAAAWPRGEARFLPILVPVSENIEHLEQLVEGLLAMDNLNKTMVVFSQEGDSREIEYVIRNIPARMNALYLHRSKPSFSITSLFATRWFPSPGNMEFLLSFAFDSMKAPGAIVLQSDLLPSTDMYDYFEWSFRTILQNPSFSNVLSINGFNKDPYTLGDLYRLTPDRFKPRGWCISAEKWPLLRGQWAAAGNWGYNIEHNVRIPYHMVSLTPMVARVRNVRKPFPDLPELFTADDAPSPNETRRISYEQEEPYLVMSRYAKLAVKGFRYPTRNSEFGIFRHEY
ncbi:hypothetical protein K493DRAFT_349541 [Basidiobolus meristosporus CBS 931.73]|uniref:Nucleotide-diphospho-sugar transferase n=1 Tax=Basidiobolus meristosporus CBS 931.73 TaxID=1314790 RepID=A0A1Y1YJJ8_9FUNG|nr:hypothetical protein K493DRAFT_349541 [Basidiobolus meristosporus CBS 931.73]|eukprot:ORX98165.1 hypothetical protein K493DRAFT_349541 [Basidiobolus meristosporus CBS 931.73]